MKIEIIGVDPETLTDCGIRPDMDPFDAIFILNELKVKFTEIQVFDENNEIIETFKPSK